MQIVYAGVLAVLGITSLCCCCCPYLTIPLFLYGLYAAAANLGYLPKKNVRDQHVFITGAGSGIGALMALKFADLGCKLTLADINLEGAQAVAKKIGPKAQAIKCDVSSIENVKKAAQEATSSFGDVHILINNAGIVSGKKILQNSEFSIQKTIEVNTIAHHWTVRAFLPKMLENNQGHIVTIASIAGILGVNGLADYCASKFGAVGFDESLRMELGNLKSKVKTTCICPYYIDTGMFHGVQSKYPFLLPILNENYATQRIVNAILQDEPMVMLPWICNIVLFAKSIMPCYVFDRVCDILGANASMEHFVGRK